MVGSALVKVLEEKGFNNILKKKHHKLDLIDQKETRQFFSNEEPDYVFLTAAKVGGIYSNSSYKADFIYDNLSIQLNLIQGAYMSGVQNLIFLGCPLIFFDHLDSINLKVVEHFCKIYFFW